MLGGRYVLGRFSSTYLGQPMEGLSIDGYDNAKQEYFSLWFDTMGTGFYETHGQASADGKTIYRRGVGVDRRALSEPFPSTITRDVLPQRVPLPPLFPRDI